MTDKKKEMVKHILDIVFEDLMSEVMWAVDGKHPREQRWEFTRPIRERSAVRERCVLVWDPSGEFHVWRYGSRGAMHPVYITSKRWFRVGKYLQANFPSTQAVLGIHDI